MLDKISAFYAAYFDIGDRLGERFYAIWMAVISIGLLNSGGQVTPGKIAYVVGVALVVNLSWGVIDGVTVMFTNIIDRVQNDRILYDLRTSRDGKATAAALASLADGIVAALPEDEQRAIVAQLAATPPGPDPRQRGYRPNRDDWLYAAGIVGIDVAAVIPVVLPIILITDTDAAIYVSRLIATAIFAVIGADYARNLNYRRIPAALLLGGLGFAVFTHAYATGW